MGSVEDGQKGTTQDTGDRIPESPEWEPNGPNPGEAGNGTGDRIPVNVPETHREEKIECTTATLGTERNILTQKDTITSNTKEVMEEVTTGKTRSGESDTLPPGWMELPLRLRKRLTWKRSHHTSIPDRAIIMLYVGKLDGGSIDETIERLAPETKGRMVAIDNERCKRTQDMSTSEPYNSLCTAASEGKLSQVGGGPMCRTWSVRRLVWKPGGGLPCRGIKRDNTQIMGI